VYAQRAGFGKGVRWAYLQWEFVFSGRHLPRDDVKVTEVVAQNAEKFD